MMPRPTGRGIIDLAVEVVSAYLDLDDQVIRLVATIQPGLVVKAAGVAHPSQRPDSNPAARQ
jgi:hypothetical protein